LFQLGISGNSWAFLLTVLSVCGGMQGCKQKRMNLRAMPGLGMSNYLLALSNACQSFGRNGIFSPRVEMVSMKE
jgi:hypothetical protein